VEGVVAVQTLLLRAQLPELPLRPGASVVARVLSRGETHGVIVIAGIPLTAELPERVGATGETLKLSVSEVTPERVTLHLDQVLPAAGQPAPQPPPRARVTVEDPPRRHTVDGEERATVALSFTSDTLGRLDFRLEVAGTTVPSGPAAPAGRVRADVQAAAGAPFEAADAAAPRLRDGLVARTGLAADVRITPRRDPLDVYA
jgi:hypothetical protein